MHQKIRLVLAGGGSGGHITPNIAIIDELKRKYPGKNRLDILYIGSRSGMEREIVQEYGIPFKSIYCGKLRRYFSWQNFLDLLKIPIGIIQSYFILKKFNPDVVFCKGGYVSLPVTIGGYIAGKKVVLHESDVVPGLANKLSERFAHKVLVSFEESRHHFKHKHKVVFTGNPVRRMIAHGSADEGYRITGFGHKKPVILVIGGSLGATAVNSFIWNNLGKLLRKYYVVHITGKGKKIHREELYLKLRYEDDLIADYRQFEFLGKEMSDIYAMADLIVGRAGAITLAEIDYLHKPAILIPLDNDASRGDQLVNSEVFVKTHNAMVMRQGDLKIKSFLDGIEILLNRQREIQYSHEHRTPAAEVITNLLLMMI